MLLSRTAKVLICFITFYFDCVLVSLILYSEESLLSPFVHVSCQKSESYWKKSQETTSDEQNALHIHFAKIQITVGKNNLYSLFDIAWYLST